MNRTVTLLSVTLASMVLAGFAAASDWPQWRGPDGTGYAPDSSLPLEFSDTTNVKWKVEIPGKGYASPIIKGDRIYVMTAVELGGDAPAARPGGDAERPRGGQGQEGRGGRSGRGGRGGRGGGRGAQPRAKDHDFIVMALDRASGDTIWATTVKTEKPHEGMHRTSTHASISPVVDDECVIASFGSRGIFALDLAGNVLWEKDLGDMTIRNSFGEGASPALYGDTVVVPWDHEGDSFVVALDKRSGSELWRVNRRESSSWSTPVMADVNGSMQVILSGNDFCRGYDLASGTEIWRCSGMTPNTTPTPIVANGMVYLTSGFRGAALIAVKLAEAKGDITGGDAVAWTHNAGTPYVPSPMLAGQNLYFLKTNSGILSCVDAMTGKEHYADMRLGSVRNVYASIVGAAGRVYVFGREGNVAVIADGPEYKLLATNSMGQGINATPAIAGNEMFIRGDTHLFCIAE